MSIAKLKDTINEKLTGEQHEIALNFVAFLEGNDLLSVESLGDDGYNVFVKEINSAYVKVNGDTNDKFSNSLLVVIHLYRYDKKHDFSDGEPMNDDLREFVWAHVMMCPTCGSSTFCDSSKNQRTILGKAFESTCQSPLVFFNLNADEIKMVQKLLLMLY